MSEQASPEPPDDTEAQPPDTGEEGGKQPPASSEEAEPDRSARPQPGGPLYRPVGISDSVMAPIRDIVRAALPMDEIAKNLRAMVTPDVSRFVRQDWAKAILAPQTDAFLRQVRLQMPALDFSRFFTPELTASLARVADWLKRLIPENLLNLKAAEWERLIEISEEQRIGIVWIPREATLRLLLDADTEEERSEVLRSQAATILDDCSESLQQTTHEAIVELVTFAHQAISSHREGHTAAAQALATNVLDTALEQHHVSGVKGMLAACKQLQAQGEDGPTVLEMRLRLATAGIPHSYRTYKYEGRDPRFSRNGTAHAVNSALYTPDNSLRAITLATAWLRWLHETWAEEERRAAKTA